MNNSTKLALPNENLESQYSFGDRSSHELKGWPRPPSHLPVYDKASGMQASLGVADAIWRVPHDGKWRIFEFADGNVGLQQRTIILHVFGNASTSGLVTGCSCVTARWSEIVQLLSAGPLSLRTLWGEVQIPDDHKAYVKKILQAACVFSVGTWSPAYVTHVKSLQSKQTIATQGRVLRREKVLSLDVQAALANLLDTADVEQLTSTNLEAFVALSLIFQHGIRPVQVLSLETSAVRVFSDIDGNRACLVSFHMAKQKQGKAYEMVRQVKPEWARGIELQLEVAQHANRERLFSTRSAVQLNERCLLLCRSFGIEAKVLPGMLRHSAAQSLADAGHSRASIQAFLGHSDGQAASHYISASPNQAELINSALGISKLYSKVLSLANKEYVSLMQLEKASEDQQIGAVLGDRLISGIGLCRSGQSSCQWNPVTSCYGCKKFIPSLDRDAHADAILGMREQVGEYLKRGIENNNPAYRQMTRALAGAQQALASIDKLDDHDE